MRIAYRAETLIDAHLVKDALESADIPAFVAGEYLTGAVGNLPALDYVAVLVPEASLPAAMAVVREVERELIDARLALDEQYGDEEQAGDDAPSFMPA
ncbi:DUF2007 domain-containing protein [Dyella sp. LX-66]|uniref:putative signal transducing protein n=1 Tax=unclassified Dyella TaxID=2634549 RepID=UPI001BE057C9|nr:MULTISPECIES: DUF2007 domain-containing protein [unclassified Dyella]MBT2116163.1 DUF2007 domain-containing protein [Dyella sp. LX-1]MBT2138173.1 DUF2007 domain-containing protein [Dyella sp. LX-66]